MENIKFKCMCGSKDTSEQLDSFFDEENLTTDCYCNGCGTRYAKSYKLVSFEGWD